MMIVSSYTEKSHLQAMNEIKLYHAHAINTPPGRGRVCKRVRDKWTRPPVPGRYLETQMISYLTVLIRSKWYDASRVGSITMGVGNPNVGAFSESRLSSLMSGSLNRGSVNAYSVVSHQ